MGTGALIMMVLSKGSVALLVVLYSINVFITFTISQVGMVKHWWEMRGKKVPWKHKRYWSYSYFLYTCLCYYFEIHTGRVGYLIYYRSASLTGNKH